jgi:hypothetical protein
MLYKKIFLLSNFLLGLALITNSEFLLSQTQKGSSIVQPALAIPAASNPSNLSNTTQPAYNGYQPQIRIDANQLINAQNLKQEKKLPPDLNKDYSGTAPNNTRIGSNGNYIDNSSSEQITSSGLICKSDRNSKKCN